MTKYKYTILPGDEDEKESWNIDQRKLKQESYNKPKKATQK